MLEKKYDYKKVEAGKYENWLEKGFFKAGNLSKEPFCIVIPPPNVTGNLHLGHAWDTALQDIIIRYKRMDGFDALWLPGMDHAGISTQAKVDAKLRNEGIDPRSMNRDEWLKIAWQWKDEYALNIRNQWAKLGLSLDYSRERFTLDEGLSKAVLKVFISLYEKGFIYRGERIINWDVEAKTAISNEEVIHKELQSSLYFIKYFIEESDEFLVVATTRPETIFGDTAVAIAKGDKRYKHLIGKKVLIPISGKAIPIIEDEYVDASFGTGAVKITPAHDANDFEVGERHGLKRVVCINPDGLMNDEALQFSGLDRFVCRREVVQFLENLNLIEKVESIKHAVGHSERSDSIVEPYLSKQWFVKMDSLAKSVLELQKKDDKINFIPPRFEKILIGWMENVHDWCISRQLWWGHQIPIWYKGDELVASIESPGDGFVQDPDVLDTWFSSALWPFSTLGWPDDLDMRYFPNNCLVTGYDIIFFWVSRMIVMGLEFTDLKPFNDVLIHGILRDNQGRKMSKSLGNGIDPMDVIDQYGADTLRFFLATNGAPGQDMRYDEEKIKATWNFINKLWNASRYVLMNENSVEESVYDRWILDKMNKLNAKVRKHMDKYEFNIVGMEIYHFVWHEYCDWYLEFSKLNRNDKVLREVLVNILKLLHPFMPFVTEEIYGSLGFYDSIMISEYPIISDFNDRKAVTEVEAVKDIISRIRNLKAELKMVRFELINNFFDKSIIENNRLVIEKMLKCQFVEQSDFLQKELAFEKGNIIVCYEGVSNDEKRKKLLAEKLELEQSIKRREDLLSNENYLKKAPKAIVELDEEKLLLEKEVLKKVICDLEKSN